MNDRQPLGFDEIPSLQGRTFTLSGVRIGLGDKKVFDDVSGVTETYEGQLATEYADDMIEGFHSLSLLDYLINKVIHIDPNQAYGFNYGLDRVRFPSVTRADTDLTFTVHVASVQERGEGYLVTYECQLGVDGADKPGMTAEWLAYVLPRVEEGFK